MGRQGTEDDTAASDIEEDQFIVRTCDPAQTRDPRAVEDLLTSKLQEVLSIHPTLPLAQQHCSVEPNAARIPSSHCAFRDCHWSSENPEDLVDHVVLCHRDILQPLADKLTARDVAESRTRDRTAERLCSSRTSKICDAYPDPRGDLESRSPNLGPYTTKGTL